MLHIRLALLYGRKLAGVSCVPLGKGSKIGAGSTVIQDIPPLVTAVGNPAKVTAAHS